jgi:hypothetical protein
MAKINEARLALLETVVHSLCNGKNVEYATLLQDQATAFPLVNLKKSIAYKDSIAKKIEKLSAKSAKPAKAAKEKPAKEKKPKVKKEKKVAKKIAKKAAKGKKTHDREGVPL